MQTAQITVAEVKPPQGKGPYKIIDTAGAQYSAWAETGPMFKPGHEYSIDFEVRPWTGKDGMERTDYVVKKARQVSFAPNPGPAPGPKPQQNGVGFRPSMAPKDAQEARISLLCQAYAQAGIVPSAQDVETLVMNVTRGVTNATPKLTSPQRADDMADEIPY